MTFKRVRRRIFQSVCLLVLVVGPNGLSAQNAAAIEEAASHARSSEKKRPKQRPEPTMSDTISTLLLRNLQVVFGENDPARRRVAIDEIFAEDCVFYEPN